MNKGVYCIIIYLPCSKKIRIGKLGSIKFPRGYYCYIGSALNNLKKRIQRHLSKNKKFHWHIDYFLKHSKIIDIKTIETQKKIECELSKDVAALSKKTIVKKFGSSDCNCRTHLHFFKENPLKNKKFSQLF
jgi:sugar fermentation stimulation protein A